MPRTPGQWVRRGLLRPLLSVAAVLYFLLDALVFAALRPVVAWIGRLRIFARLNAWIARLGPYPTLVLFVVPLAVLEPLKPLGLYLMGTGHALEGGLIIAGAEILKITLVERLFRISRDKLLTIPAFAWCYVRVVRWLDWLNTLPPWVAVKRVAARVREAARGMVRAVRGWFRAVRGWVLRMANKG